MRAAFIIISFLIGCIVTTVVRQGNAVTDGNETVGLMNSTLESADVAESSFGVTKDGEPVTLYSMKNANGLTLKLMDYGATVVSLETPDRSGKLANVVLSFPDIKGFQDCEMYFNATVGRYCNRIAKGKFKIGEEEFELATNNGENHLHGGTKGFDKRMWKGKPFSKDGDFGVAFSLTSPDGDEGYPGKVDAVVTYTLTKSNELVVEFRATTDKPTHINLTNHNYWNLAGEGNVLDYLVQIHASKYIPVDAGGIPTGRIADVAKTQFDFSKPTAIGSRIQEIDSDPVGYDHCFVIEGNIGEMHPVATVNDPKSGRVMEVLSTEPGLQFYTGNFLNGEKAAGGFAQYSAFCMETQHYPDTPNQPSFPTTLLDPASKYFHKTVHKFSVDK